MSEIISTTSGFGLTQGTLISLKVSAINSRGAGDFSDPNTSGAVVEIVPWQPSTTARRGSQTTETQLEVTWDYLTGLSTGGSTILSYELQLNTGSGFVEVVGDSLGDYTQNSAIIKSGLISGFSYTFRYRARNVFGWGEYSQLGSAIMSGVPTAVTNVVVSQNSTSTKISIAWSAPSSNGGTGILITQYNVAIQGSDGNLYSDTTQCSPTSSTTLTTLT